MSIADKLLPEFDQEMAATRRVLERVPDDDPDWKPHPKSFSIAHLAQLLAGMPGWIGQALTNTELELASGSGHSNESTTTLLECSMRTSGSRARRSPRPHATAAPRPRGAHGDHGSARPSRAESVCSSGLQPPVVLSPEPRPAAPEWQRCCLVHDRDQHIQVHVPAGANAEQRLPIGQTTMNDRE
jgi:hypothetical protein